MKWLWIFVFAVMFTTANATAAKNNEHLTLGVNSEVWFKGGVEQAFDAAKDQNKLLFIYWGAQWCPPCNSLKNAVFSRPEFPSLIKGFVPVYLDGDTDAAQKWGEKLSAIGYPTMMVLSPKGEELIRLSGTLDIKEFEHLIAQVHEKRQTIANLVESARSKKATASTWAQLAYADWPSHFFRKGKDAQLEALKFVQLVPPDLRLQQSLIRSTFLMSGLDEASSLTSAERLRWLTELLQEKELVLANRYFISHYLTPSLNNLKLDPNTKGYRELKALWLKASALLRAAQSLPIDARLSAIKPDIEFYQYEKKEIPADLIKSIKRQVEQSMQEISNPFQAHFVVTDSSDIYRTLGDYETAKKLLIDALPKSKSVWYLQAKLSRLEQLAGNEKAAIEWARKARQSAQGRATKLEWIRKEMLVLMHYYKDSYETDLSKLISLYYESAFQMDDGFVGRNDVRAKPMIEALKSIKKESTKIKAQLSKLKEQCPNESCRSHFTQI